MAHPGGGKTGLENPVMAPVKAICFLEKGTENSIRQLTEEEGALWNSSPASDGRPGRAPLDFQDWMRKFREKK